VTSIERYALDRASMLHTHPGTFMKDEAGGPPEITNPIPITLDWADLLSRERQLGQRTPPRP
jgi:hypothetical protein